MPRILLSLFVVLALASCSSAPESPDREAAASTTAAPGAGTTRPEKPDKEAPARADDAVPDFAVTTFDGEEFRLSDHVGTPVVLNFFESW